jgi:hypothetical protein
MHIPVFALSLRIKFCLKSSGYIYTAINDSSKRYLTRLVDTVYDYISTCVKARKQSNTRLSDHLMAVITR